MITNLFRDITLVENENYELSIHHEFSVANMDHDELMVQNILKYINDRTNSFMTGPLRNLATQVLATDSASESLLNIFRNGCKVFNQFFQDRFKTKIQNLSEPIKRNNIPTLTTNKVDADSKKIFNVNHNNKLAQRILDLAIERKFDLKVLFSYELTHISSLFESECVLKKEKSKYLLRQELIQNLSKEECKGFSDLRDLCVIFDVIDYMPEIKLEILKNF